MSDRPRQSTIYDVARLAGVSHQTVSRYVKGYEGIRPATRVKVESALAELDYRPNMVARSLATSRSHRIGALAYEMLEQGPSKILSGAATGAREAGYLLDIVSLDPRREESVTEALDLLNQQTLAGVFAMASTSAFTQALAQARFTVPVFVEAETEDSSRDSTSLNGRGLLLLVEHLHALGHRRFFHVGGPQDWLSSRNRLHAYRSALEAYGLLSVGEAMGDWSAASGFRAAAAVPLPDVTAIVAGNDQMALGVLRYLHHSGVRVPEDVSVVGFDDLPESGFYEPPLTTVALDFEQQGRVAIHRLLAMIGEPLVELAPVTPTLRVRASTGSAAAR